VLDWKAAFNQGLHKQYFSLTFKRHLNENKGI